MCFRPIGCHSRLGPGLTGFANLADLVEGEVFDSNESVLSSAGPNELIEFGLDRGAIPVLRVLDQKDHQERDNGGSGIDDELPGVGEVLSH
jgi:hypothetical protein